MLYYKQLPWLVYLLLSSVAFAIDDLQQVVSVLKPHLSKEAIVTFPWDSRWQTLQITASTPRLAPDYSVVVEVVTESDIQATVKLANRFSIPFLAISGGHAWTNTLKNFPYGIQINMRKLNTTVLSRDGSTATVGGGMLQHELTRSLFAKNKYAVTGLCECTSLAGPLLGGGHSFLQGQYGYAVDGLVSARVVLANGNVVTASRTQNADLFWALQGAGHNFGILASLQVKVHDIPSKWTVYSFVFLHDKLEALYSLVNEFEEPSSKRPAKLAMTGAILRLPDVDPNNPVIAYTVIYEGSEADADLWTAQFKALGSVSTTILTDVEYEDLYKDTNNGLDAQPCTKNQNIAGSGISLPAWDLQGLRKAFTIFANFTTDGRFNKSVILTENYGMQGVRAADPTLTSLPLEERQLPVLAGPATWWDGNDEQDTRDANAYLEVVVDALYSGVDKSGSKRHTYVNYAKGDEKKSQLYGDDERLKRLIKLKEKWDPQNKFAFYNSIA